MLRIKLGRVVKAVVMSRLLISDTNCIVQSNFKNYLEFKFVEICHSFAFFNGCYDHMNSRVMRYATESL